MDKILEVAGEREFQKTARVATSRIPGIAQGDWINRFAVFEFFVLFSAGSKVFPEYHFSFPKHKNKQDQPGEKGYPFADDESRGPVFQ